MSDLSIGRIVLGIYQTNCYFIHRDGHSEVIIVDAPDAGNYICDTMEKNGFHVAGVLLTHGHFDHIQGLDALRQAANERAKGCPERGEAQPVLVYACEAERELLGDACQNVSKMTGHPCSVAADVYVKDGEEITIAGMTCRAIATPGHTAGCCCYYFEEAGLLVSGDTLFLESVGRTDFPTGSMGTLVRSVKEKLFCLPDDTRVFPGHGEQTTIGHEKMYNPYF